MALSTLDTNVALVVIDLQKGIVSQPLAHPTEPVIANATRLAEAFRTHKLPVVLVNVTGSAPGRTEVSFARERPADWAELIPELDVQDSDSRITKQTWGAFHATSLDNELRNRSVTQIVLAGIATTMGVESTARSAYEHGYNVVLATDAMTDRDIDAHNNSVERIFPRLGETATTAEILAALSAL